MPLQPLALPPLRLRQGAEELEEVSSILKEISNDPCGNLTPQLNSIADLTAKQKLLVPALCRIYPNLFSSLAEVCKKAAVKSEEVKEVYPTTWPALIPLRHQWLQSYCPVDDLGSFMVVEGLPRLFHLLEKRDSTNDAESDLLDMLILTAHAVRCAPSGVEVANAVVDHPTLWLRAHERSDLARHSVSAAILDVICACASVVPQNTELQQHAKRLLQSDGFYGSLESTWVAGRLLRCLCLCTASKDEEVEGLLSTWKRRAAEVDVEEKTTTLLYSLLSEDSLQTAASITAASTAALSGSDVERLSAVVLLRQTIVSLPVVERCVALYDLPGNPLQSLLWMISTDACQPANLLSEVLSTLTDVFVVNSAAPLSAEEMPTPLMATLMHTYQEKVVSLWWSGGMAVMLHSILDTNQSVLTAAVSQLLSVLVASCQTSSALRIAVFSSACTAKVVDEFMACAALDNAADVLRDETHHQLAIKSVLELISSLTDDELRLIFNDDIVFATSTIVSAAAAKVHVLLDVGIVAMVRLASVFYMATMTTLDFEFCAEQSAISDPPAPVNAQLIMGTLRLMSTVVERLPEAVTFEWIETLVNFLQRIDTWRVEMPSYPMALWRCVEQTMRYSSECAEYLFQSEVEELYLAELDRVTPLLSDGGKCFPILLGIAACLDAAVYARLLTRVLDVVLQVEVEQWEASMCANVLEIVNAVGGLKAVPAFLHVRGIMEQLSSGSSFSPEVLLAVSQLVDSNGCAVAEELTRRISAGMLHLEGIHASGTGNVAGNDDDGMTMALTLHRVLLPTLVEVLQSCPDARAAPTRLALEDALLRSQNLLRCCHQKRYYSVVVVAVLHAMEVAHDIEVPAVGRQSETYFTTLWQALGKVLDTVNQCRSDGSTDTSSLNEVEDAVYTAVQAHLIQVCSALKHEQGSNDQPLQFIGKYMLRNSGSSKCVDLMNTLLNFDLVRSQLLHFYRIEYVAFLAEVEKLHSYQFGTPSLSLQLYLNEAAETLKS